MPSVTPQRALTHAAITVGVALAYYLAFRLEMFIALDGTVGTLVQPSAGLVFALAWVYGPRVWLGVLLGAIGALLIHSGFSAGTSSAVYLGCALALAGQGTLPAWVLRRIARTNTPLASIRGTWLFVGASIIGTGLSAVLFAASVQAPGALPWERFVTAVQSVWSSGLAGILIVGPFLLRCREAPGRGWRWRRVAEVALATCGQATLAFFAFASWHPDTARMSLALSSAIILFFLWIAWRIGSLATSFAVSTTTAAAILGTALALSRFTIGEALTLDVARTALIVIGVFALTITAALVELRASRSQLRDELGLRLRRVIDTLPGMIFVTGPDKECLEVNQNWIDYRGTTREEELGFGWFESVHPADRKRMLTEYARLFEAQRAGQLEFRCRRADGVYRWFLASVSPTHDSAGQFSGYSASCVDITERKSVDQERVELNVAVEHAMTGVARLDAEGRYVLVRRSYAAILGYHEEELLGCSWQQTVPPEDHALVERTAARAAEEGRAEVVARGVRKDGSRFYMHVLLITTSDASGDGHYCFMRDVSERVAAEARQLELADELRQTQKLEAVGTLASGVAHDFNNMLTAIQGHADAAAASIAGEHEAHEHLHGIEQAAEQAAGVSQSLLTFSQRTPSERKPIDLETTLAEAHGLLRRLLPDAIESELEAEERVWISASPVQLQQVLINLAINAREAMPDGGRLLIRLRRTGTQAVLQVSDTGHGIAEEIRPRILEPFFTTRPRERGTGLGLSIVHGIVSAHDGTLEIESEPGHGTTIEMRFPLCEPAHAQLPATAGTSEQPHSTGLVLVVEDHAEVRRMVVRFLERAGFSTLSASDGNEALVVFRRCAQEIQAVVSDLELPKLSGLACVREMRRSVPDLPVVLISGNVSQHLSQEDCERETVLHKPFKMALLVQTVESAIAPRPPAGQRREVSQR